MVDRTGTATLPLHGGHVASIYAAPAPRRRV